MRNVEAKFKLYNLEQARKRTEALGYAFTASLRQRDTFFRVQQGKLKLREDETGGWLICYSRENSGGLSLSHYEIFPVPEPERMREALTRALGVLVTVRKERVVLQRGNVRFHLDRVDGLGDFGEAEAVLGEAGDPESGRGALKELLDALGIGSNALIGASYLEMLRPVQ